MLKSPTFWEEEKTANLLNLNEGFLEKQGDNVFQLVANWPELLGVDVNAAASINFPTVSEEISRIVERDAERTFVHEKNRKKLAKVLCYIADKFGDYQQGLSYVASLLLLFFDEPTVAQMLTILHSNKKYIPGYWRAEAVDFAIDANVFNFILSKTHPEVSQFLEKNIILPETYCQKWFAGLCIHVLTFETLFKFIPKFFERGFIYLFSFGLAFFEKQKEKLLTFQDPASIYGILRFDKKFINNTIAEEIFNHSLNTSFKEEEYNFEELRKKIYEEKLKKRVEEARQRKIDDGKKKNADSDTDEDDDDDDDEEGAGLECTICVEMMPDFYCKDCNKLICENCHEENKDQHDSKKHKVSPLDEIDDVNSLAEKIKKLTI